VLDKPKQSTSTGGSGGGKSRSSKSGKVRRSPYQIPVSSSSSTAGGGGKLQATRADSMDGGGSSEGAGLPLVVTLPRDTADPPPASCDYAGRCDVVKV